MFTKVYSVPGYFSPIRRRQWLYRFKICGAILGWTGSMSMDMGIVSFFSFVYGAYNFNRLRRNPLYNKMVLEVSIDKDDVKRCMIKTCRGTVKFNIDQVVPVSEPYVALRNLIHGEKQFVNSGEELVGMKGKAESRNEDVRLMNEDILRTYFEAAKGAKVDSLKDKDRFLYYFRVRGQLYAISCVFHLGMTLDSRRLFYVISGDLRGKDKKVVRIIQEELPETASETQLELENMSDTELDESPLFIYKEEFSEKKESIFKQEFHEDQKSIENPVLAPSMSKSQEKNPN